MRRPICGGLIEIIYVLATLLLLLILSRYQSSYISLLHRYIGTCICSICFEKYWNIFKNLEDVYK